MNPISRKYKRAHDRRINLLLIPVVIVIAVLVIGLMLGVYFTASDKNTTANTTPATSEPQATPKTEEPQAATNTAAAPQPATNTNTATTPKQQWPVQLSNAEAASITAVVNKKHQLPSTYIPANLTNIGPTRLRQEAATALNNMFTAAKAQGYSLKIISGYRSYNDQKTIYANYVIRDGQALADTYSARPGFSEHQTGLSTDIGTGSCDLETCFGDTMAGQWVAANAHLYGFIVRYPKGAEQETGYQYEPWHLRYLGTTTAKAVHASGKTLDQYYNVPAGGYE